MTTLTPAAVEALTILRGLVGSTTYNLHVPGTDDRDEMGVCIEPPTHVVGLQQFEQLTFRTAVERLKLKTSRATLPGGGSPKSEPGDLDLTIYGLRKFARLASSGNPSILMLLYLPNYLIMTPAGRRLVTSRRLFASRRAVGAFLGYLTAQRERLEGRRGQRGVTRPVCSDGYDTKYAMHMCRLGYQGVEYATFGQMTLPLPKPVLEFLKSVRAGAIPYEQVLDYARVQEDQLRELRHTSPLPAEPDTEGIDDLLIQTYTEAWRL